MSGEEEPHPKPGKLLPISKKRTDLESPGTSEARPRRKKRVQSPTGEGRPRSTSRTRRASGAGAQSPEEIVENGQAKPKPKKKKSVTRAAEEGETTQDVAAPKKKEEYEKGMLYIIDHVSHSGTQYTVVLDCLTYISICV